MNDHLRGSEEYEITDRDKRLYQENKKRQRTGPRELSDSELDLFLTIIAEHRGTGELETKLGLTRTDAEQIKAELNIDIPQDARSLLNQRVEKQNEHLEEKMQQRRLDAKEEWRQRQARLDAANRAALEKPQEAPEELMTSQQAKAEWRQREARAAANMAAEEISDWRLPNGEDFEVVDRFKTDILLRGMNFCMQKYGVSAVDVRVEANRLGLGINWDLIHR